MLHWKCNCACHNPDPTVTVMHIMGCCNSCPTCHEKIKIGFYNNELHKKDCGKKENQKNSHCSFCSERFPGDVTFPHCCTSCNNFTYTPPVTCVMLLLSILREEDCATGVLLIRRLGEPMIGGLALPGGYLDPNESFEQAAVRELVEETGVEIKAKDASYLANRLATDGNMLVFMTASINEKDLNLSKFKPNKEVSELVIYWDKDHGKVDICFPTHDEIIKEHFFTVNGLR